MKAADHPAITHVEHPGQSQGIDRRYALCGLDFPRPAPAPYIPGAGWWTVKGRMMHRLLDYQRLRPHRMSMSEENVPPAEKITCVECQGAYVAYRLTNGAFL